MATATTVLCPACGSPCEAGQAVCANCGRVFDMAALRAQPLASPQAPPGDHFAAGQSLSGGRYRVLRPLSRGGMGALYLATDQEAFGRTVVVKTLLTRLDAMSAAEAQSVLRRFIQEASTLATLRYPTIPQIYSYFQDGPLACMVMEYIEGEDLSHGLSRPDPQGGAPIPGKPYPIAEVFQWAVALCRTLEYLASKQPPVVHQDIKPANLIRDLNSDQLYLVDFGAARAIAPSAPGPGTAIFGTPGYAAPEQYRGECGPASDVYALAATLYHLATDDDPGDHPFAFPRMVHMGYLGRVLQGALASDPAQRPTATDLRRSVEALLLPDATRALTAPDGETIRGEIELARWCERHWEQARAWLYADLPGTVERELVQIALADQLRGCVARHANNHDAGLDEVIARLDPRGFGMSEVLLQLSPPKVDMGSLSADTPVQTQVRVHNAGRRYVRATLATPTWLAADTTVSLAKKEALAMRGVTAPPTLALDLRPGQEIALFLAPIPNRYTGADEQSVLVLRADRQVVARVPVSGAVVPHLSSQGRPTSTAQGKDVAILFFVLLFIMLFSIMMSVVFH